MTFLAAILLAAFCVFPGGAVSARAASLKLPLTVPPREWRPLEERWDQGLQARLDQALKANPRWRPLVREGKMAVAVVDLADPKAPRFARVNGDIMMYAASLPKLAVLLAAFQGFEDGTLKETPELRADLIEMIRRSDNFATNKVIARLGLPTIQRVICDPRYRFYDAARGGGLWVGSDYGSHLQQSPEPLKNLDHAATVTQVCRFYYLLAYGKLINPRRSGQMLKILAFPDLNDKFVYALGRSVPSNYLYRKSGEWKLWYSDSILVWSGSRRYILVSLVENAQGEQILRELLPAVEHLLRPCRSQR
uniref:beta-lactamase n=1 Tax=Desulfobacca acetoxidans TaxID=60893 RepID=A0A7C3UXN7_9BACT